MMHFHQPPANLNFIKVEYQILVGQSLKQINWLINITSWIKKLLVIPFVYSPQTPIFAIPKKRKNMLIIDSKDCENIDKALKKYKKKYEKSKTLLQLRERQAFIKPSIRRRGEMLKAIYKQKIFNGTIES